MDQLLKELAIYKAPTHLFTLWEALICITMSFILNLIVAWTYKKTHSGISYSQSFVHTMVMMGVIVSVIMLIIGSNIARAFSLVGALSIIRFRNAVKETKDVGYIFFAMAVGMACGTRFYILGIVSTLMISLMMFLMDMFNFGAKQITESILKVNSPPDFEVKKLHTCFKKYLSSYSLISVEEGMDGRLKEHVYLICEKKNKSKKEMMDEILQFNEGNRVSIVYGQQKLDI